MPDEEDEFPGLPPARCKTHDADFVAVLGTPESSYWGYECGCKIPVKLEEPASMPPDDEQPMGCRAHGSPFARVQMKVDGSNWRVFEDGCEELL